MPGRKRRASSSTTPARAHVVQLGTEGGAATLEDEHLTEYERERAAQIARNKQRMAELQLPELGAALAERVPKSQHHQRSEEKGAVNKRARKADRKAEHALPRRTSLRQRGLKADGRHAGGIEDELRGGQIILKAGNHGTESEEEAAKERHPKGPLPFKSNFNDSTTDEAVLEHLRRTVAPPQTSKPPPVCPVDKSTVSKLQLQEQHVAKVTRNGTTSMEFRPSMDQLLLAAGDKDGNISLWDVDHSKLEGASQEFDGVITFPGVHKEYISSLRWAGASNLITSAYDGSIRLLDINKPAASSFVDLTSGLDGDLEISAMDVQTDVQGSSGNSGSCCVAYVGDKDGDLHVVDLRAGTTGKPLNLHHRKLNMLHMEPSGAPLLLSASTDASVKVWDVRKLTASGNGRVQPVSAMQHSQSCHSAYWAPDGSKRILSTSFDDTLKIWCPSGLNIPTTNRAPLQLPPTSTATRNGNNTHPPTRTAAANAPVSNEAEKGTKRSWQGTISHFFGSASARAAAAAGMGQDKEKHSTDTGAPSELAGSEGGVAMRQQQGQVKGSWREALCVRHDNQTGRWVTPFRAIWGAASDIIMVGNMQRGIDIFAANNGSKLAVLSRDEAMTAIPSRIAVHPTRNVLAAATASGRVHVWR